MSQLIPRSSNRIRAAMKMLKKCNAVFTSPFFRMKILSEVISGNYTVMMSTDKIEFPTNKWTTYTCTHINIQTPVVAFLNNNRKNCSYLFHCGETFMHINRVTMFCTFICVCASLLPVLRLYNHPNRRRRRRHLHHMIIIKTFSKCTPLAP